MYIKCNLAFTNFILKIFTQDFILTIVLVMALVSNDNYSK